ncbi:DUF6503 family protein [Chondrinema litorale]|uniref:DUF6503 family protein n=1 Tax=Chondrinema litorale TaxID=2994555 RepID=UPI0025439F1E|nr:DUF6503 family protein [Chondrinema litorale]UZR94620.1 hypothetical protein OQ292_02145 [Chondrinema litorale]
MKFFYFTLIILSILSCSTEKHGDSANKESINASDPKAQSIVEAAIEAHGNKLLDNAKISFEFRDRQYIALRNGGKFQYERIFTDSIGNNVRDVLSNNGFYRETNGDKSSLPDERVKAFSNSVNSVIYFALLPYFLNDQAVQKEYLGETTIKEELYDKVKVTFKAEGGGKDHDDEYVYFFHKEKHTMDYLAYNYQVNGGGARFREAYNVREVEGILFADYINYEALSKSMEVAEFDSLFNKGQMKELSRIESENIVVEILAQ